jgi:hypothetical protein
MKIELRPLAEIKSYEHNPRLNDAAVDVVAESIRRFGFRQPIVVDGDGVIVCGHTRWKAATKLKLEKVPVHVATDLTPEQIRAYRIADNKSGELATWNMDLLPLELAELQDVGIDWSQLGFDEDELVKLLGGEIKEGLTDPDNVPEPPDEAITQRGDLWVLGEHRLLCGDSATAEDVDRLLDGAPIHLCNTDPPYNVKVEPRSSNAIAAGVRAFRIRTATARSAASAPPSRSTSRATDPKGRHARRRCGQGPTAGERLRHRRGVRRDAARVVRQRLARVLKPGGSFYIWGGYANLGNYPGR